ncbi:MAG: hypothetical protein K2J95_05600 [Lachnospiraceae bacterium]|nr:hypothetical protein [Lachnospiraceae bacterium]
MKKLGRIVRILVLAAVITVVFAACENTAESVHEEQTQETQTQREETQEEQTISVSMDEDYQIGDESEMKLYINDQEIPVIWEDNETVSELMEQAEVADITVQMSMYSDNEQVGPLGKDYTRDDKQTTTHNGDIVLYSGNQIVVFYGSNSWAYTRLGKMDISQDEVNELLSNGDVVLKLSY